ncbi:probable flap endonuclease 1 homolog isoform X2 [Myxocyprinus asiaticus]|uniref:probable flap endonuclease 1 homolog isoform X2 n=1 Tax=Myxocyprinus asiaticus TaxID=70543 RepID=UPI00222398A0|nr:probable flap endonuclease 1 homolog isoform X2 [Myxocyprinus asiaticus]
MGISKLAHLIRFDAPTSVRNKEIGDYSGEIIALDTSIVVNQFRSAVPGHLKLSPLTGLFYRTLTFLEHDIKPVFVFDGRPPNQKRAVLEKRAQSTGWGSSPSSNTVSSFTQDCHRLLQLMGVPCIMAPGEAEALCAHLVKSGTVNAVASEDMDTLAFGGTVLLRQLNAKRDSEVTEYSLPKLLEALQLTHKEFVDLCILLGCDYCDKIGGLGPSRALKLIKEHHTIEGVMEHVNRKTHPIPLNWEYKAARKLFFETPQIDAPVLVWNEPDEEGLVQFLCKEKPLKEEKVRGRIKKFHESLLKRRKQREVDEKMGPTRQSHLQEFFPATRRRKAESADVGRSSGTKRSKTK